MPDSNDVMFHTWTNPIDASSRLFVFQTPGMLIAHSYSFWASLPLDEACAVSNICAQLFWWPLVPRMPAPRLPGRSPPLWLSSLAVRVM